MDTRIEEEIAFAVRSLDRATEARQWKLAEILARRLERLDLARAGAIDFDAEARKRGRR